MTATKTRTSYSVQVGPVVPGARFTEVDNDSKRDRAVTAADNYAKTLPREADHAQIVRVVTNSGKLVHEVTVDRLPVVSGTPDDAGETKRARELSPTCGKGHDMTDSNNIYYQKNASGSKTRMCIKCRRLRQDKARRNKRGGPPAPQRVSRARRLHMAVEQILSLSGGVLEGTVKGSQRQALESIRTTAEAALAADRTEEQAQTEDTAAAEAAA